ncbi:hypothetical protein B0H14DRAFT_3552602 [Mycena olivaceomarginata]|nr:hypothetical protein B0H14DRAFT_3552602 [Mycena olivaceomarginata]
MSTLPVPVPSSVAYPPHPSLQVTTLFISSLPTYVLEEHITRVFEGFYPPPTLSFTRTKNGRNRGTLRPCVDFLDLRSAERALAIHHLQPIPFVKPPVIMIFSTIPGFYPKSFGAPDAAVSPRLIKTLPAGCTESTLYDILRPYGPIYSLKIDAIVGGLVQFWDEAHAQDAEMHLAAEQAEANMILNSYDPRSLVCSYKTIVHVDVLTNSQTDRQGIVTFSQASEASTALQAIQSIEIRGKVPSVTYRLLGTEKKKPAAQAKLARKGVNGSFAEDDPEPALSPEPIPSQPQAAPSGPTPEDAAPQDQTEAATSSLLNSQFKLELVKLESAAETRVLREEVKSAKRAPEMSESGLKTLQLEKEARRAQQAENEILRRQLESVTVDGAAEINLLRETLESVKLRCAAENERLREELESVELQSEAEITLLREKLETATRALEMSESKLKILQLEADRPLWEAAKRKREENERAERAKEEERRRAEEVVESRRKMREFLEQDRARKRAVEEERLRREAEENARREKEEAERKQREKEEQERKARDRLEREKRWKAATQAEERRCAQRDQNMWGSVAQWTPAHALERLEFLIEEFNTIKFSEAQPLTYHVIPWPVLADPYNDGQFGVNVAGYNTLVEKVHRLFHPDKWKSRRLLVTVMDEELRKSLEEAGNVVAQAMTPIWRKSKGYN